MQAVAFLKAITIPLIVLLAALLMIAVEVRHGGRKWPKVRGWWLRALLLNGFQVGAVWIAGVAWNGWMLRHRLWSVDALGVAGGSLVGYLAITFFFYWWHRWRHESDFLWRWFHQVHHSPQRIEVVTSFYKHPFEILADGALSSAILYFVVGLGPAAAAGGVLLSGLAELVYHWNVKTPYWLGFFFQRPESHCVHHEKGVHSFNYSDLPVWDVLFGTFRNPREWNAECGFDPALEQRFAEMLLGSDVHAVKPEGQRSSRAPVIALLTLGLAQMTTDALHIKSLKSLAAATAASPAPKVFSSVRGLEPYSSRFFVEWNDKSRVFHSVEISPERAARMRGPYNRRNVYGAVLAYGPVLESDPATRAMFESVAQYALCGEAPLLRELGIPAAEIRGAPRIRLETRPGAQNENLKLEYTPSCN